MAQADFDSDAERTFVAAALAGDDRTMGELAQRLACVPRILATRNARMGRPLDPDELADVVQDTFLAILRRLPGYRPIAPLESWLFGVCCVQIRDAVRNKARSRSREEALVEDAADSTPAVETRADLAETEELLERLGGLEAVVVRLKHLEELTFEEVGRRLRVPSNTAKTHYYRGLAKLRSLVARRREESA